MRFILCLLGFLCMCGSVSAGHIAAVVNDEPISDFDIAARVSMMQLQQGGLTEQVSERIKKQALNDLIDEKIKTQEAVRQGLSPTDEDINRAIAHLEQQNGLGSGGFRQMLVDKGIPFDTMTHQIAADLGWMRVLQKAGIVAEVSDAEITAREKMIRQDLAKESLRFAEIVVPTEEKAIELWQQLQNGGDFRHLVKTESTAASRTDDGQVIGVDRFFYGKEAAAVLGQMQVGQLSRPIAVPTGYALILMLDRRDAVTSDEVTVWELAQAAVPADSVAAMMLSQSAVSGCDAFTQVVADDALPQSVRRGQVSPEQLSAEMQGILSDAPFKTVIGPVQVPEGLLYFMKCGVTQHRIMPEREVLKNQIEREKTELKSRQKLAEIKRGVVVEYK